jgi:hypothetical protein
MKTHEAVTILGADHTRDVLADEGQLGRAITVAFADGNVDAIAAYQAIRQNPVRAIAIAQATHDRRAA